MNLNKITLGCDPELFLENELEIISAEGLVGGTKKFPREVEGYPGHFVQEDNIMVEFNIPPTNVLQDFTDSIKNMLEYIEGVANIQGFKTSKLASGKINPLFLNTPQAKTIGCEPDFNVYSEEQNPIIEINENFRSCGGHIHVGYPNSNEETSAKIIKAMDITLGLNSLLLDKDDNRRKYYGKAGSFRFKSFGLEYRTLSNFWIFSDDLIKWAFEGTFYALQLVKSGIIDNLSDSFFKKVENTINTNNKKEVKNLLNTVKETINSCVEYSDM